MIAHGQLKGVLDLDSAEPARFDAQDREGLNAAAALLLQSSDVEAWTR
jgi:putative methionine-R-sulfoxide reductase with GAF domain